MPETDPRYKPNGWARACGEGCHDASLAYQIPSTLFGPLPEARAAARAASFPRRTSQRHQMSDLRLGTLNR